jgi:hypothetical protein
VFLVGPLFTVFKIELPSIVGTGNHAVPASDTSVVVDNDNAIIAFVGSLDGTDLGAGWFIAVIAQQEYILPGGVGLIRISDSDFSDPMIVPAIVSVVRHVVLEPACFHTGSTARSAPGEINDHAPSTARRRNVNARPGSTGGAQ